MLSANEIAALHDRLTQEWHIQTPLPESLAAAPAPSAMDAEQWQAAVTRQHLANFELWHIEDEARVPNASDAQMAAVKRRIDPTNQRRNDLAEALDLALLAWLDPQGLPDPQAELHSESPGLIIDRLSILALKIFHTREEAERADASPSHIERNRQRLAILLAQRNDLAGCLQRLWEQTLAGTRRFKLYRQLKMYNDPSLNPAVYRQTNV